MAWKGRRARRGGEDQEESPRDQNHHTVAFITITSRTKPTKSEDEVKTKESKNVDEWFLHYLGPYFRDEVIKAFRDEATKKSMQDELTKMPKDEKEDTTIPRDEVAKNPGNQKTKSPKGQGSKKP